MTIKDFLQGYDFNLSLKDVINDPEVSITRRMLAGAVVPQGLDSAYYMTMELYEAFNELAKDRNNKVINGRGHELISDILGADGEDYQRRIYYIVSDIDVYEALGDLAWLVRLTRERARMFPVIRESGAVMPLIPGSGGVGPVGGGSSLPR